MTGEAMDLSKYQPNREFLLYKSENGNIKVDVLIQNETIWMPQEKIAELFGVQRPAITKHLKNIFDSGELSEQMVSSILEHTTRHGAIKGKTQNKSVKYYNLDMSWPAIVDNIFPDIFMLQCAIYEFTPHSQPDHVE